MERKKFFTKEQEDALLACARGRIQREIVYDILDHGRSDKFHEYCKSQAQYSNYSNGFSRLYSRMRDKGLPVVLQYGERGGMWNGFIEIDKKNK